ncbi:hypothetical protein [Leptolyngbya iicbica]|nr:hypothetical protein [Leptolyngbya sp. LK]
MSLLVAQKVLINCDRAFGDRIPTVVIFGAALGVKATLGTFFLGL